MSIVKINPLPLIYFKMIFPYIPDLIGMKTMQLTSIQYLVLH